MSENFGRLPAALLATVVREVLLRRLLAGPVVADTGVAVIENCEVPYELRSDPVAETLRPDYYSGAIPGMRAAQQSKPTDYGSTVRIAAVLRRPRSLVRLPFSSNNVLK